MTCTCDARVGERHARYCVLTGVKQPEPYMEGHPSLYRRPLMSAKEQERFQHRLDNIDGCDDDECLVCWGSPWSDHQGHSDEVSFP